MTNFRIDRDDLRRGSLWLAAFAWAIFLGSASHARPGTHGPSMSTWDTRASSVVLQARLGFMEDGHFDTFSYNANFTSTTGRLSAQFGLHYLNLKQSSGEDALHGASASATAVMEMPVTDRFDNGVPITAVAFYIGAVPAVLTAGQTNDITIPLVFGLGIPVSPADWITITPWAEPSISGNLDSKITSFDLGGAGSEFDDLRGGMGSSDELSQDAVGDIVDESVEVEFSANLGLRAGLDFAFHLGAGADINIAAGLSSLGSAFSGPMIVTAGGALVWRWDDIVPTVLPGGGEPDCVCASDVPAEPCPEAPEAAPAPAPQPMTAPAPAPSPNPPAPTAPMPQLPPDDPPPAANAQPMPELPPDDPAPAAALPQPATPAPAPAPAPAVQ